MTRIGGQRVWFSTLLVGFCGSLAAQDSPAPQDAPAAVAPSAEEDSTPEESEAPPVSRPVLVDPADALVRRLAGRPVAEPSLADQYQLAFDHLLPDLDSPEPKELGEARQLVEEIALHSARPGTENDHAACVSALSGLLTRTDGTSRDWITRQLILVGDDSSVVALAPLLAAESPETADIARRALQAIGSDTAAQVLADALPQTEIPRAKVALIHSLGVLARPGDVDLLAAQLVDSDETIRNTSITAIASIGGEAAAAKLIPELFGKPQKEGEKRGKPNLLVARGLLEVGTRSLVAGESESALKVFGALGEQGIPAEIQSQALAGRVRADPDSGVAVLRAAFEGGQAETMGAAVRASEGLPESTGVIALLREHVRQMPPEIAASILRQFRERKATDALPEIRQLTGHADPSLAVQAVATLRALGGSEDLDLLLRLSSSEIEAVRITAKAAVAEIGGDQGDAQLIAQAADKSLPADVRALAIRSFGPRGMKGRVEELLGYLSSDKKEISSAAVEALGTLAGPADIPKILQGLRNSASSVFPLHRQVLQRICRAPENPDVVTGHLLSGAAQADEQGQSAILDLLPSVGGASALEHVRATVSSESTELQARALACLAAWPEFTVAPDLLLHLENDEHGAAERALLVGGLTRLARNTEVAKPDQRLGAVLKALPLCKDPAEIKMLCSALGAVPSPESAKELLALVGQEEVAKEAAAAAIQVASEVTVEQFPERLDLLQRSLAVPGLPDPLREKAQKLLDAGIPQGE